MSDDESKSKQLKLSIDDQNIQPNDVQIAGSSHQDPSLSPIFNLTVDCCDEIFDYLSLEDLNSFGKTCKTFQKVAGEYFKRNYLSLETFCGKDGTYTSYSNDTGVHDQRIEISIFNPVIANISYYYQNVQALNYLQMNCTAFTSLNQIFFVCQSLSEEKVEYFKELLPKMECIRIRNSWIKCDFYENYLKLCTNLKRLSLRSYIERPTQTCGLWLQQSYPKLEHLEMIPFFSSTVNLLNAFFQRNTNIRSFAARLRDIWINIDEFINSTIKLDTLEIKDIRDSEQLTMEVICKMLNQLHERGFYKKLHFHVNDVNQAYSVHFGALKNLEMLCIKNFTHSYNLIGLTNLKELAILNGAKTNDMEILANHLNALERLYIKNATFNDILPFIRRSMNLKKIKVLPKGEAHFNGGILNLMMLNDERTKLFEAKKVTIYVPDNIFLKTKWTTKNGDIDLKFVEMRRIDSIEWNYYTDVLPIGHL